MHIATNYRRLPWILAAAASLLLSFGPSVRAQMDSQAPSQNPAALWGFQPTLGAVSPAWQESLVSFINSPQFAPDVFLGFIPTENRADHPDGKALALMLAKQSQSFGPAVRHLELSGFGPEVLRGPDADIRFYEGMTRGLQAIHNVRKRETERARSQTTTLGEMPAIREALGGLHYVGIFLTGDQRTDAGDALLQVASKLSASQARVLGQAKQEAATLAPEKPAEPETVAAPAPIEQAPAPQPAKPTLSPAPPAAPAGALQQKRIEPVREPRFLLQRDPWWPEFKSRVKLFFTKVEVPASVDANGERTPFGPLQPTPWLRNLIQSLAAWIEPLPVNAVQTKGRTPFLTEQPSMLPALRESLHRVKTSLSWSNLRPDRWIVAFWRSDLRPDRAIIAIQQSWQQDRQHKSNMLGGAALYAIVLALMLLGTLVRPYATISPTANMRVTNLPLYYINPDPGGGGKHLKMPPTKAPAPPKSNIQLAAPTVKPPEQTKLPKPATTVSKQETKDTKPQETGDPDAQTKNDSDGPGSGGGIGTGTGTGIGSGTGAGEGPEGGLTCESCPQPDYTLAAMQNNIKGTVVVELVVTPEGKVIGATLLHGIDPQLDQNALKAVRTWKFKAFDHNGPVRVNAEVEFGLR